MSVVFYFREMSAAEAGYEPEPDGAPEPETA